MGIEPDLDDSFADADQTSLIGSVTAGAGATAGAAGAAGAAAAAGAGSALYGANNPAGASMPLIGHSEFPRSLEALLDQLGLRKYLATFADQDVDLQVFLSLTDNDLKEVGIK